jgi:hypothetical protein
MKQGIFVLILLSASLLFAEKPDTLWTRTYGGTGSDWGESVQEISGGGFIIAGKSSSFGVGGDVYLIKTDASGDTFWTKTYGGTSQDYGESVRQTRDGGFIIAGETSSSGAGSYDVYLIKTDVDGNVLWTRTYGGTGWDEAYSVEQTSDQGFIVTGYTMSYGAGQGDVYLIKTDSLGNLVWSRTYGGAEFDRGWAVQEIPDKGYIIAGQTDSFIASLSKSKHPLLPPLPSDVYVIGTDSVGDTLWTMTVTRTGITGMDWALSIDQTSDQGYIITGMTQSSQQVLDVYLVKIGTGTWTSEDAPSFTDSHILFVPSFFQNNINIRLSKPFSNPLKCTLYDISGKAVFEKSLTCAPLSLELSDKRIAELPSGVYFLSISSDKKVFPSFKLLKIAE